MYKLIFIFMFSADGGRIAHGCSHQQVCSLTITWTWIMNNYYADVRNTAIVNVR